jgi:hypothetical protein
MRDECPFVNVMVSSFCPTEPCGDRLGRHVAFFTMKGMKSMKIGMLPPDSSPFMLFMSFMVRSYAPAVPAAVGMAAEGIFLP